MILPGSQLDTSTLYRVTRPEKGWSWDARKVVAEAMHDQRDDTWWLFTIDPFHPTAMPLVLHSDDEWEPMTPNRHSADYD